MDFDASFYMQEALQEAKIAESFGEVPVGAIIIQDNRIISRAYNKVETLKNPCAHAEILAIQQASAELGTWRLNQCSLFVTLEPCTMCIGAMILARVPNLFFGCSDPRQGAVGSLYDLSSNHQLPHSIKVISGLLEADCRRLLADFFAKKR